MKKILSMILALSLCFAFLSCGAANYNAFFVAAAAKESEVNYQETSKEDYKAFLDKLDVFAAKLTQEVYADSDKESNLCISPVSVYMALALTVECTDGATRDEILSAVGVTYEEVASFTKVLYSISNQEYYYRNIFDAKKILAFEELSNSIWADKSIALKGAGVNTLASNYNCDLFHVNFQSREGERAIESYIKEKTHGLVDSDIDLSPETLITLINTFYLKEVWNYDGDELKRTDVAYDFKNADGSTTGTRLLQGYYANGQVYEGEKYTSFYTQTDHRFDIKFLLPKEGYTVEEVFTAENLYQINNLGEYSYVDHENRQLHHTRVFFPEYKASYDGDLAEILQDGFGIKQAFDIEQSDFSGITEEKIVLNSVIHKCSLDVNRKGIEGAAVTVVPGAGAGAPPEYTNVYHDYIVDAAFGFVITDSYGTVLFSGVVNSVK